MKLDGIDIDGTLKELELTLVSEKDLLPALKVNDWNIDFDRQAVNQPYGFE